VREITCTTVSDRLSIIIEKSNLQASSSSDASGTSTLPSCRLQLGQVQSRGSSTRPRSRRRQKSEKNQVGPPDWTNFATIYCLKRPLKSSSATWLPYNISKILLLDWNKTGLTEGIATVTAPAKLGNKTPILPEVKDINATEAEPISSYRLSG